MLTPEAPAILAGEDATTPSLLLVLQSHWAHVNPTLPGAKAGVPTRPHAGRVHRGRCAEGLVDGVRREKKSGAKMIYRCDSRCNHPVLHMFYSITMSTPARLVHKYNKDYIVPQYRLRQRRTHTRCCRKITRHTQNTIPPPSTNTQPARPPSLPPRHVHHRPEWPPSRPGTI